MIALPCGEKNYNSILSRFHIGTQRTDGRTDRIAISILCARRVSMLTLDKNLLSDSSSFQVIRNYTA